jgi:hypothetical protein
LATEGNHEIRVRAVDAAGNFRDATMSLFVDRAAPAVEQVVPPTDPVTGKATDAIEITFSEPMRLAELIADGSILRAVGLTTASGVTIPLSKTLFSTDAEGRSLQISLGEIVWLLPDGNVQLRLDGSLLTDIAGNALRGGAGTTLPTEVRLTGGDAVQANGGVLQTGGYSVPAVADWNSDGRWDLIVGEKTTDGFGKVRVYLNSGTSSAPRFTGFTYAQTSAGDYATAAAGCLGAFPRLVDWNGDGKKDLLVGQADGRIHLLVNENTSASPRFAPPVFVQVGEPGAKTDLDVGDRAAFDVCDWNEDGRFDLVVGGLDGQVRVVLNSGTANTPDFRGELPLFVAGDELVASTGRASVSVGDLDADGRKDVVLGNTEGELLFYRNVGSNADPQFDAMEKLGTEQGAIDLSGSARSRPCLADVNGDGRLDLLVGSADGTVRSYLSQFAVVTAYQELLGAFGGNYVHTFYVAADPPPAEIAGRHIFYNNSWYDRHGTFTQGDSAANVYDDNAIATDKEALLGNVKATFANYTSFSKGINGIMVDIAGLPGTVTASDFVFKVGNNNSPSGWASAPAPTGVALRDLGDGVTRVTITWPDGAIKKQWLQVTVLAANTGLTANDIFYFGNALGDSGLGDTATRAIVNSTDEYGARTNPHTPSNRAPVTDAYDYDRNGLVNSQDEYLARTNGTTPTTALQLVTFPATLMAIGGQAAVPSTSPALTADSLAPLAMAALADWARFGVDLSAVRFAVANLSHGVLGEVRDGVVYLDDDAAGHGWFVDSTPARDEEFAASGAGLRAVDAKAVDRIDLFSVIEHELGHVAGLRDLAASSSDLMNGALGTGVRRKLAARDRMFERMGQWE